MCELPNELIICIYELLGYKDIIDSLELFPFLHTVAIRNINMRNKYISVLSECAKNGYLDVVIFMNNNKKCFHWHKQDNALYHATMNGHLDIIKIIYNNIKVSDVGIFTIFSAAENGHLNILIFFYNKCPDSFLSDTASYAAKSGHLYIIKWLYQNCKRINVFTFSSMYKAVEYGHIDIVRWFYIYTPYKYDTGHFLKFANLCGHINLVIFFEEENKK